MSQLVEKIVEFGLWPILRAGLWPILWKSTTIAGTQIKMERMERKEFGATLLRKRIGSTVLFQNVGQGLRSLTSRRTTTISLTVMVSTPVQPWQLVLCQRISPFALRSQSRLGLGRSQRLWYLHSIFLGHQWNKSDCVVFLTIPSILYDMGQLSLPTELRLFSSPSNGHVSASPWTQTR